MNCDQVDDLLQGFIDGDLPADQSVALINHHKTCEACNKAYTEQTQIKSLLQNINIPPHSEGFVNRVLDNATSSQPSTGKHPVTMVLSGSIAASLAIWLFVSGALLTEPVNSGKANHDIYQVAVSKDVKTIKLAIDSSKKLEGVTMSIELTPNLELSGYRDQQSIQWNTNFHKGINVLSLPITGLASGNGEIITRVQMNGKKKIMRIQTHYQMPVNLEHQTSLLDIYS
jgi:hypothetical protein